MQLFELADSGEFLEYLKENHNGKRNRVVGRSLPVKSGAVGVRSLVNHLRSEGAPICSDDSGYWYSTDPDEVRETLDSLDARMASMNRAFFGMLGTYKKMKSNEQAAE